MKTYLLGALILLGVAAPASAWSGDMPTEHDCREENIHYLTFEEQDLCKQVAKEKAEKKAAAKRWAESPEGRKAAAAKKARADAEKAKEAQEDAEYDAKIKPDADRRQAFAEALRQQYLDRDLNIFVSACEPISCEPVKHRTNKALVLTYALFDEVWENRIMKSDLVAQAKTLGFSRLVLRDGYHFHSQHDLQP